MSQEIANALLQSWSNFATAFVLFVPRLVAAIIIFVLGLVVALLVRRAIQWLLVWLDADRLSRRTGASEMGVHPVEPGGMHHQVSLMCDDIHTTVDDMKAKGVEFVHEIRDDGFGLTAAFVIPGGPEMMIYEPRHPTAYDME